jgi:hypothetical protein
MSRTRSYTATAPTLLSVDGRLCELSSLWADRRCCVAFLRHAGCRFCAYTLAELNQLAPLLTDEGITTVAVTLGTPEQLQALQAKSGFVGELYAETGSTHDASRYFSYIALRLKHGESPADTFTSATWEAAKDVAARGITDSPYLAGSSHEWAGDAFQLGGVFVFGPGNHCDFAFRSQYAGHQPDRSIECCLGS